MFFETYTEKVWGIPCRTISARWAAQRIRGLSLRTALMGTIAPWLRRHPAGHVKTLIHEFEYPRLGPGMMWEAFAERLEQLGGSVLLNARVTGLNHDGHTVSVVEFEHAGRCFQQLASNVISTMPLAHLVTSLAPGTPANVQEAARALRYRDFIMVALVVDHPDVFPDNWIYIHDQAVRMGRIQNFKNWSPDMVPDASKTCLGLEYFCTAGDEVWSMSNDQLVALAKRELGVIGLVDPGTVIDATVVRAPNAYPVYDEEYQKAVTVLRRYVGRFANVQTIGRNGTHTYNNQDHSMVMGMLAVRNLFGERHDLWAAESEGEYFEELRDDVPSEALDVRSLASSQPLRPTLVRAQEAYEPH
jgi:protoporphyrinogen oxidase